MSDNVLRNEHTITPLPTENTDRNDAMLNPVRGSQPVVVHRKTDLTVASTMVCHTIAHAP